MQIMGFYIMDFVIIANWPPLVQSHSVVTLAVLQSQECALPSDESQYRM